MFQCLSNIEFLLLNVETVTFVCVCTHLHIKRRNDVQFKFLFLNSVVFKNSSLVFTTRYHLGLFLIGHEIVFNI